MTEAKNGLSALIDAVQGGETIVIIDRGRPVARLDTAISTSTEDPEGRMARLQRSGIVRPSSAVPAVLAGKPPRPRSGESALSILVDERLTGR